MTTTKDFTGDAFYTEKYSEDAWRQGRVLGAQNLYSRISKLNLFKNNSKVLDVGCGSGEFLQELKTSYGVKDLYGVDLNQRAVEAAKALGIHASIGDIDTPWQYESNSFDVVIATEIIEHVINPDFLLTEAQRILKPEGHLVLSTPNLACWFNRIIFLAGYHPFLLEPSTKDKTVGLKFTQKLTEERTPVGHIRCFTLKSLTDIFELNGIKPIFSTANSVAYLPKYMQFFEDHIFSKITSLATDIIMVGKKEAL